ncbi:hypothetical protein [Nonomuraea sp. SYSU D8015]|uniref:hypothetical protein n=1 Tax=Nonomuraea sp. SYSU D8015 TaxID=2593644 RepID=UPI001660E1B8|nr:hypothetical protein [Nonomuraea sp. SYSU D8015]
MADDTAHLITSLQKGYLEATAELAVAEAELERLRVVETASIGAHALLADAEAAIARVREIHGRDDSNPHGPWCGTCTNVWPCATWRALGGEEPDRG